MESTLSDPVGVVGSQPLQKVLYLWTSYVTPLSLIRELLQYLTATPWSDLQKPTRITRNMHALHYRPLSPRTNCYKYSFIPNTIRDWNNLPDSFIEGAISHPKPEVFIVNSLRA